MQKFLEDPVEDKDSTNSLGDTIKDIFLPIFAEFKDLIGENEDKKSFTGDLIKIFTIILSSRSTALAKITLELRTDSNRNFLVTSDASVLSIIPHSFLINCKYLCHRRQCKSIFECQCQL